MSEKWYVVNEKGEVLREASPNERVINNGQSDYLLSTEKIVFDFVVYLMPTVKNYNGFKQGVY